MCRPSIKPTPLVQQVHEVAAQTSIDSAQVSLSQHLRASLDPQCPSGLVSPAHVQALHALTARLPSGLCEFFGFESRLGDAAATVDVLLCAKSAEGGREVLAGLNPVHSLPAEWLTHPVWQRIRHFAQAWADPSSPLYHAVQNVWLEFDIDDDAAAALRNHTESVPVPSVFIGTDALRGPHARAAASAWLLPHALPCCLGHALSAAWHDALCAALEALPTQAQVFQIGMMLGRPHSPAVLRLCVRGLHRQDIGPYLHTLQWPGDLGELQNVLDFAAQHTADSGSVDLDIDLSPTVGPKIGLECSFGADRNTPTRLAGFLDALVAGGLCLPTKREGLMAWSGGFHERSNPAHWPPDLRRRSAQAQVPTVSMFMRWVYHVKLVYMPQHPLQAKAYLAVRQAWITPAFIRHTQAIQPRSATI